MTYALPTKPVRIYTTPACVYCKLAKQMFDEHGVLYEEFNVAEDDKAREEMFAKSRQMGVPVIEIGNELFVGFDKKTIAEALGIKL